MDSAIFILGEKTRFANYQRAVEAAGGSVRFSCSVTDAGNCCALLLPGGGDLEPWRYGQPNTASRGLEPERDAGEFALLDLFCTAKKPVLGICRGLQTINVYFGGTLEQDIAGHSQEQGMDRMHPVRTEKSFLFPLYGERSMVNSAHHQAVCSLGCGLLAVQRAMDGVVEGLCHKYLPVWGVQWHPERMADGGLRLFDAFLAQCR